MTTIAYRSGVLAADTLLSNDGFRYGHVTKIQRRDDGALVGGCGNSGWCAAFRRWFLAGERGDPPANVEEHGIVITPDGELRLYQQNNNWLCWQADFYAFGSGREAAMGAMMVGATAEEAVCAALKLDGYSGGEITVLRLEG